MDYLRTHACRRRDGTKILVDEYQPYVEAGSKGSPDRIPHPFKRLFTRACQEVIVLDGVWTIKATREPLERDDPA